MARKKPEDVYTAQDVAPVPSPVEDAPVVTILSAFGVDLDDLPPNCSVVAGSSMAQGVTSMARAPEPAPEADEPAPEPIVLTPDIVDGRVGL